MHTNQHTPAAHNAPPGAVVAGTQAPSAEIQATAPGSLKVIRRNGKVTPFDRSKIEVALTKAFLAVEGNQAAASDRIHHTVAELTTDVFGALTRRMGVDGGAIHIEDIQDQVELALMRNSHHKIARAYVIYREERARERQSQIKIDPSHAAGRPELTIKAANGSVTPLDWLRLTGIITEACEGLDNTDPKVILDAVQRNVYDEMHELELGKALVMSARQFIETDPQYNQVTARLLMGTIRAEALEELGIDVPVPTLQEMAGLYADYFRKYLSHAISLELVDSELAKYDLDKITAALDGERDQQFTFLGLQTLYDRYFIHNRKKRFELPQAFFMRVAMGLAINEKEREDRAIEFYRLLSSFDFMSSTPTLFNSGTLRPQLSSCYLTTVPDDLYGIYGALQDNAMLSKFAGGLGNDWTPVRGSQSWIKGTNGQSNGVIPFLKVANDSVVAVNQGGKRKGAACAYLETWHTDLIDFIELRKNVGDERRRCHDINTANWVPDLFMKRVMEEEEWTLFSPSDCPDLHDLTGAAFEARYTEYEAAYDRKEIPGKRMSAVTLWRKMLGMLFETGHPWITFKDPCNLRSPQQHAGVVHSSNLCTEITLNTKAGEEIAVCNLGSINLPQHLDADGNLMVDKLRATTRTAMRMLDNVVDYNYYAVDAAKDSNLRHRPVGLGVMGFQDALHIRGESYESDAAVTFADNSMEQISYFAIEASSDLAAERGAYESFPGSLWSQGILPIDSIALLAETRGQYLQMDTSTTLDWGPLREKVKSQGMRNSNCMAIAPTATIANITGVSQSIEPTYQNLFVKSNLSGEYTVLNTHLVTRLQELGIWDEVMVHDLKFHDGSVQPISRIPDHIKDLFKCAFEVDPNWLIKAASRRQKWIDQAQSLNLYLANPSGMKLDAMYKFAWVQGLKTTYYLRSMGATSTEKATVTDGALNKVAQPPATPAQTQAEKDAAVMCSIQNPDDCEACQ